MVVTLTLIIQCYCNTSALICIPSIHARPLNNELIYTFLCFCRYKAARQCLEIELSDQSAHWHHWERAMIESAALRKYTCQCSCVMDGEVMAAAHSFLVVVMLMTCSISGVKWWLCWLSAAEFKALLQLSVAPAARCHQPSVPWASSRAVHSKHICS